MNAKGAALAVALLVGGALAASCSDTPEDKPCTGIPPGGCPLSYGVACDDPACAAAYACTPGNVWVLDHVCPPHPDAAAPGADAASDAIEAAPPPHDASIDAPPGAYGGPGCDPLEVPDCSLGFALACPQGCCDCEDLFVCQNGGWVAWGTCSADGGIRQQ